MGRVLSGAGSPQNPASTRSLRREGIRPVRHFLPAPTGLKETVNASQLPLPEKVPQEEEMASREEVRPSAKSPEAVVESGEGALSPDLGVPPRATREWRRRQTWRPRGARLTGFSVVRASGRKANGGWRQRPALEPGLPHDGDGGLSKAAGAQLPGPGRELETPRASGL